METAINDPLSQPTETGLKKQIIQNGIPAQEGNSNSPIEGSEEEETEKTIQRRPQFRFNENNKRRFF